MKQKVLVIDDITDLADAVANAIKEYKPLSEMTNYEVKVLKGVNVFSQAKEYIEKNSNDIDIVFSDYNLNSHYKGTELFKLLDKTKKQVYRILHSVTTKSQTLAQDDRTLFDYFCTSKDKDSIQDSLGKYEAQILDIKLNGHPGFREKYFISNNRLSQEALNQVYNGIQYLDVLFVESDGRGKEGLNIYYRNKQTQQIDIHRSKSLTIKQFRDKDLFFRKVSNSLIINLLWVTSINRTENRIRFITNTNTVFEKIFAPTSLFNSEILPLISTLESSIPSFFTK